VLVNSHNVVVLPLVYEPGSKGDAMLGRSSLPGHPYGGYSVSMNWNFFIFNVWLTLAICVWFVAMMNTALERLMSRDHSFRCIIVLLYDFCNSTSFSINLSWILDVEIALMTVHVLSVVVTCIIISWWWQLRFLSFVFKIIFSICVIVPPRWNCVLKKCLVSSLSLRCGGT